MKVAILGTGLSVNEYLPVYDFSIGVNDIWKYVKCQAVVCLNPPKDFTPERLKIINECTPEVFYSNMVIWDTRKDFQKIDFEVGYPNIFISLDTHKFWKSYCSPFVACQIAYKYYHATEIHLFGVDLINHPQLDKAICKQIKIHFKNLIKALAEKKCQFIVHGNGILTEPL
jgi:hypothetical protein